MQKNDIFSAFYQKFNLNRPFCRGDMVSELANILVKALVLLALISGVTVIAWYIVEDIRS